MLLRRQEKAVLCEDSSLQFWDEFVRGVRVALPPKPPRLEHRKRYGVQKLLRLSNVIQNVWLLDTKTSFLAAIQKLHLTPSKNQTCSVFESTQVIQPSFIWEIGDIYRRFFARSRIYGSLVTPSK